MGVFRGLVMHIYHFFDIAIARYFTIKMPESNFQNPRCGRSCARRKPNGGAS
jgi:hypothetical protein